MEVRETVALVTGANRGIGKAIVASLVRAGARRVYAGARRPWLVTRTEQVIPLHIDLLRPETVAAAARQCDDVALLVNNAGIMLAEPLLGTNALDAAQLEMQVNFFGTLSMLRAFRGVLAKRRASVVVNILSIAARVNAARFGSYCASKSAALSLTQAARAELASQGTRVVAVMPGFVDTDMARHVTLPKLAPEVVAERIVAAVIAEEEDVYPGPAGDIAARLSAEPKEVEREFARLLQDARPSGHLV
jgi:NAD(P)-dependent dehydrogenase (short-subunit alcohol dehydrogenase family)